MKYQHESDGSSLHAKGLSKHVQALSSGGFYLENATCSSIVYTPLQIVIGS